jgi:hypothetical protein
MHKFSKRVGATTKLSAPDDWLAASSILRPHKYLAPPYKTYRHYDPETWTCAPLCHNKNQTRFSYFLLFSFLFFLLHFIPPPPPLPRLLVKHPSSSWPDFDCCGLRRFKEERFQKSDRECRWIRWAYSLCKSQLCERVTVKSLGFWLLAHVSHNSPFAAT